MPLTPVETVVVGLIVVVACGGYLVMVIAAVLAWRYRSLL